MRTFPVRLLGASISTLFLCHPLVADGTLTPLTQARELASEAVVAGAEDNDSDDDSDAAPDFGPFNRRDQLAGEPADRREQLGRLAEFAD